MPLHRIYAPSSLYSDQERKEFSNAITDWYARFMPRFYVVILFIDLPSSHFFVGGLTHEERSQEFKPFVRWTIEHLASHTQTKEDRSRIMNSLETLAEKWLKEKGYDWEITVAEPSQELWKITGEFPPIVRDPDMKIWMERNAPFPRLNAQ